jgi:hypothetical protein
LIGFLQNASRNTGISVDEKEHLPARLLGSAVPCPANTPDFFVNHTSTARFGNRRGPIIRIVIHDDYFTCRFVNPIHASI